MAIKLLRGVSANLGTITPAIGEPVWVTDTFEFRVGDGTTVGGRTLDFVKTDGVVAASDVAIWTSDNLMGSETKTSFLSAYSTTTDINTALAGKLSTTGKAADSLKADDATTLNGQADTYYLNTTQRSTSTVSSSITDVATSSAVKAAYDNANTRIFKASISQSYTSGSTTTVSSSNALKTGVDAVQAQITTNDADILQLQTDVTNLTNQIIAERVSIGEIIEITGDATNPATLKGYGTWIAFGEGQALVGVGDFTDDRTELKTWTDGQSEGEYKHNQTVLELFKHGHIVASDGAHTHPIYDDHDTGLVVNAVPIVTAASGATTHTVMQSAGVHTHGLGTTGSSAAANNIQPTLAVYRWKRTA